MKKYELVVVVDAQLWSIEIGQVIETIEWYWSKESQNVKDDIGVQQVFHFLPAQKHHVAHFVSYELVLDPSSLDELKKKIKLTKWVQRFVFFSLSMSETVLNFKELNEKYSKVIDEKTWGDQKKLKVTI